ncbi:hypothetical protein O988_09323, partial [Pseudogymnoascus sp. VKM F-3808]
EGTELVPGWRLTCCTSVPVLKSEVYKRWVTTPLEFYYYSAQYSSGAI